MSTVEVVQFIAYSDYLCPWCWNVARRLRTLELEFDGRIDISWRSYLLRPEARTGRDLEKFRKYTESWRNPGAEPDAGDFRIWSSGDSPPTHSVPAHCVAKAAAELSAEAFDRMHARLMEAYFHENRDISSESVLREIWIATGLPKGDFERSLDPAVEARVRAEHAEALGLGANGVPAIRRIDNDAVIVGAHPIELYRRWIERSLERGEGLVALSRC